MSTTISCDGCGKVLGLDPKKESNPKNLAASRGMRWVTDWRGPDSAHLHGNREQLEFHLCRECTTTAFDAIGMASQTTTILGS